MAQRFSKNALAIYVRGRVNDVQKEWGFDPSNGTDQIAHIAKDHEKTHPDHYVHPSMTVEQAHLESALRHYGELMALDGLIDEYQLDVPLVPENLYPKRIAVGTTRYVPV